MLITGASKGIGKACYDTFKDQYDVITVYRSNGANYQGDLTDIKFQDLILEKIDPDVFINNAGGLTGDPQYTLNLNGFAACRLLLGFHRKMTSGHIINISSIAAHDQYYTNVDYDEIAYGSAKKMLSTMSLSLHSQKNKPVKVSCIDLGPTYTDAFYNRSAPEYPPEENWNNNSPTPLSTNDVTDTIKNILSQPVWVNTTTIRLDTNSNQYGN